MFIVEVIVVTIIVLVAAGLTGRALFRKLTGRDTKGKCSEDCPVGENCNLEHCESTIQSPQTGSPSRSTTGNHKSSTIV
jgi:hypothetical protein